MKKVINAVETLVDEMCEGIVSAHPGLELIAKHRVIRRRDFDKNKVALISGGGSGHEPAHAGFVGPGMLTAAVCGDVFASPSSVQVYNGILGVSGNRGTLMIVKNYSGDCMNFQTAAEMAEDDGIRAEAVYVNDDIAVKDSLYTIGRRGVAGAVFVHKIAGAAAESGADLAEVKRVAEKAIASVKSIGVALTSCTVPAKGSPTFCLGDDEMEFGVGIHGEPGIRRQKLLPAAELVRDMNSRLVSELKLAGKDRCALMVNGLGATPLMELYVVHREAAKLLAAAGIGIHRSFVGNYMTSLDMAGFSLTLLKLDDELRSLLDAPARTPAFIV